MSSGILQILQKLSEHNARIDKEKILRSNEDNVLLREVFRLAYNPHIRFFIQQIPEYQHTSDDLSLDQVLNAIETNFAGREITGNSARTALRVYLSNLPLEDARVVEMVIGKDLRCGVTGTTANKIWKDLIPEMKVMLADSDISRIKYPAVAQPKLDGLRAHITLNNGFCLIQTRNGKIIDDKGFFYPYLADLMKIGETWDGEIVCVRPYTDTFASRQESNGILNKAIRGTISEEEISRMRFNTWDIILEKVPYSERLQIIKERFDSLTYDSTVAFPILGEIVHNYDEVVMLYNAAIKRGEEGLVVKNLNSFWKGTRSKDLCKIKEILDCDLIITGWEEGTGRNAGRLGNLIGETSDGKLRAGVGTGFSDKDRDELIPENTIGKIMAVQYNQVIRDKSSDTYSLFLPRFVEIRDDKEKADSIQSILH